MRGWRVGVIVDDGMVPLFGRRAIEAIHGCEEIIVYSCTNTRNHRQLWRHAAYYALNLFSIRNPMTAPVDLRDGAKTISSWMDFESVYSGAWQNLPREILEHIAETRPDFILKLGMNLLRIPPQDELSVPILSFHHGDPDAFRGRPAGFWEMVQGAPVMGQIIQILSNKLDAGEVVAFGETRVHSHSYRATLIEAYRTSPLLMSQALRNLSRGTRLPKPCNGRNYRLPSNLTVLRMVARMAVRWLKRACYGALVEKIWRVSVAPAGERLADSLKQGSLPPPETWQTIEPDPAYTFYADPFFSREPPGILVEGMSRKTGLGEILLLPSGGGRPERLTSVAAHFSYPATIETQASQFIVPESAEASLPRLFRIDGGRLVECGWLAGIDVGLVDPTLIHHEGRFYLFGNPYPTGMNALCLWSAHSLDGVFHMHPESPLLISPRGSRMAGKIICEGGRMFRLGQDFLHSYGDGILVYEIEELSASSYKEQPLSSLRFSDRRGPHTLNFDGGQAVFDWYHDRISPAAGFRRLVARGRSRKRLSHVANAIHG